MQNATNIGQALTEVITDLADYFYEDVEQFEMKGSVYTEEHWNDQMIHMYEYHAYKYAVDLMSTSEVERLVAEYGIQKATELFCENENIKFISVEGMMAAILRRQLPNFITWSGYQMWKNNGEVSN